MKKAILTVAAVAALSAQSAFSQSATLDLSLGNLYSGPTTNTSAFPSGGLINVLVLTNGSTWSSFGSLNTVFSNLTNSWAPTGATRAFFQGADSTGSTTAFAVINFTNGITSGQEFLIVGYPSLTSGSSAPGQNTPGFFYRTSGWSIPAAGNTDPFYAETTGYGGSLPEDTFTSGVGATGGGGFTTVPEPSTYALLAMGAAALGGYVIRRRKRD